MKEGVGEADARDGGKKRVEKKMGDQAARAREREGESEGEGERVADEGREGKGSCARIGVHCTVHAPPRGVGEIRACVGTSV